MEKLQSLLKTYNNVHPEDVKLASWHKQYCVTPFPKYWEVVYSILSNLDKSNKVVEVGCGLGDVSVIMYYLGFNDVVSFEREPVLAERTRQRIKEILSVDANVKNDVFPNGVSFKADVLILVNCAHREYADSKEDYLSLIRSYYEVVGKPRYFIWEVIDDSYKEVDEDFPEYLRLNEECVRGLFPKSRITSWVTYSYPINKRSKTLYLIEK